MMTTPKIRYGCTGTHGGENKMCDHCANNIENYDDETAECKHDDMDGEYYLDSVQYEIMQETDELLKRIDEVTLSGT